MLLLLADVPLFLFSKFKQYICLFMAKLSEQKEREGITMADTNMRSNIFLFFL
jgi:hypothetical protein